MFKVRDDSKILAWRKRVEQYKVEFAQLEDKIAAQGGGRQLCIPASGTYCGCYGENGYKGDTSYSLTFEPARGSAVRVHGTVSDTDGEAVIEDGYILPSGDAFWIERSPPGSIEEPPTKRSMTPGKKSEVSDVEASTLMALVIVKYSKDEGQMTGHYEANSGINGTMWCKCGPPVASIVSMTEGMGSASIPMAVAEVE
eukprot:CAMPEP_0173379430 /NCGR_PEP_ID=MMETSP1356-20130122/2381_1 /TAXON_ID=77927 ORGANISM="Hemiselmis virescens, Strain PCC157" /NCGR_SAMPLE_ID=MMETSP1356 /ASSEMBLY_ACC=CAM_ASM_000847 /LENGTH=197 /DNA_ID=CAMNT_0014332761 /DNA_START=64 /DNA_END=654 /DNA_ORIENTATION=+